MTVCIGAICESGKAIVVAADRMYTSSPPLNLEFETDESKIERIGRSCMALAAGGVADVTEVVAAVLRELGGNEAPEISKVVSALKAGYIAHRAKKVNEAIVLPMLGQDFAGFLSRGGSLPNYLQVQPATYQQIIVMSQQFNMGLDILAAGIDSTGAYIAQISHPGTSYMLDKLGYGAVGSGAIHAITKLNLSGQTVRRKLAPTLYAVFAAKKAAEVAPGVGTITDVGTIVQTKGFRLCSKEVLSELESIYQKENSQFAPDFTKLEALDAQ